MGIDAEFRDVESFDGTRLAWAAEGSSDVAVVLANGIVCTDTYWTYLFPHLAQHGHRVVCWDYRAHGRSGPPANPNEVTLSSHARDLWAVADAAGVRRAVLVGHSMGVQTILEAYRLEPARVAGLVSLAGPYEHPDRTFYGSPLGHYVLPFVELSATPVPPLTRLTWRTLVGRAEVMYWAGRVGRLIGPHASRELMAEYFEHVAGLDPLLVLRMARAMGDHSARDLLQRIDVPTLVVAGAKDVMTPPRLAEEMADAVPGARLEVVPEGSHTLPIDDPDLVDRLVEEFVVEVSRATRTGRRSTGGRRSSARRAAPSRRSGTA